SGQAVPAVRGRPAGAGRGFPAIAELQANADRIEIRQSWQGYLARSDPLIETRSDRSIWVRLYRMDWPVLPQSARNASSPLSVNGCFTRAFKTSGGRVAALAPAMAAASTWAVLRRLAARISVWKSCM